MSPIASRRGLPEDVSDEVRCEAEDEDFYSPSWVSLDELLAFDYDATFEDRRTGNGGHQFGDTFPAGMGTIRPYREIFCDAYWNELEAMKALGEVTDTRIVFWFD